MLPGTSWRSAGAESIDAARESWWLSLRDAEEAHYQTTGGNFQTDEANYRRGFEAALNKQAETAHADRIRRRFSSWV